MERLFAFRTAADPPIHMTERASSRSIWRSDMSHTAIAIHPPSRCEGYQRPWHNPSDHHMNTWVRRTRMDRHNLMERVCSHEVGHPDPDCRSSRSRRRAAFRRRSFNRSSRRRSQRLRTEFSADGPGVEVGAHTAHRRPPRVYLRDRSVRCGRRSRVRTPARLQPAAARSARRRIRGPARARVRSLLTR
jgi:hypothetical protein